MSMTNSSCNSETFKVLPQAIPYWKIIGDKVKAKQLIAFVSFPHCILGLQFQLNTFIFNRKAFILEMQLKIDDKI
jgi:hypothetical protein